HRLAPATIQVATAVSAWLTGQRSGALAAAGLRAQEPTLPLVDAPPRALAMTTRDRRATRARPGTWSVMSPIATAEAATRPNHTRVSVTDPADGRPMAARTRTTDRTAVSVEASRPSGGPDLPGLVDQAAAAPVAPRPPSTAAPAAPGRAVPGPHPARDRTGRPRLATLAASYLRWFAPPEPWQPQPPAHLGGRHAPVWAGPDGETRIDLLDVGDDNTRRHLDEAFEWAGRHGHQRPIVRHL